MTDREMTEVVTEMKTVWLLLLLLGIVSVGVGIALIAWPGQTLAVVTILFGSLMLVSGVVRFIQALFDSGSDHRWLLVLSAIVSIILGIVIVRNPGAVVWLIVLLTGILWIIGGMVDMFRGVADKDLPDRGVRVVLGAIAMLFGAVILLWPAPTVLVFAFFAGAYSVFFGVLEIVAALQLRKAV